MGSPTQPLDMTLKGQFQGIIYCGYIKFSVTVPKKTAHMCMLYSLPAWKQSIIYPFYEVLGKEIKFTTTIILQPFIERIDP